MAQHEKDSGDCYLILLRSYIQCCLAEADLIRMRGSTGASLLHDDVESLRKLYLYNPYILTLPDVGDGNDKIVPKNVQQLSGFNTGLFDYLIATDNSDSKENEQTDENKQTEKKKSKKFKKRKADSEFGVVKGIEFKKVQTSRASEDRTIPLSVIAERTKLTIEDVEYHLMKSLSITLEVPSPFSRIHRFFTYFFSL
ncbi:hypothetical protein L2E82_05230 [Cichorium intybus]|uniref:Uncharacterized protein n=1 Tax=Cichorium intybus TaxID=13427 RepID=A0ACB9H6U8_CICIN|nr:hypothetical protein L2E82_05230 [Cichorium intybus]